jgi:hypothetical protein
MARRKQRKSNSPGALRILWLKVIHMPKKWRNRQKQEETHRRTGAQAQADAAAESGWRNRMEAVEAIKRRLQRDSLPRLQMTLILMITGACGFLCTFTLLHLGLTRMWLRYPLAVLCAYGVFLLLLRLWLAYQCGHMGRLGDGFDLGGLRLPNISLRGGGGRGFGFGRGGDFGGGGAGGSWTAAENVAVASMPQPTGGGGLGLGSLGSGGGGGGGGGGLNLDFDLDEGWVIVAVVLLVVAALALVIISGYIIYAAPALLAEVFVDGALVTGLYRRLPQEAAPRHWLRAVVRRTWWLVFVFLLLLGAAGYAMQRAVPDARSIGGVWQQL